MGLVFGFGLVDDDELLAFLFDEGVDVCVAESCDSVFVLGEEYVPVLWVVQESLEDSSVFV